MRLIAYFALFVGVAVAAQEKPLPGYGTPSCIGKQACEAMWLDAKEYIQVVNRMRLRIESSDRAETYMNPDIKMVGMVVKYPITDDAYEMRADFSCVRQHTCDDMRPKAIKAFNAQLNGEAAIRQLKASR